MKAPVALCLWMCATGLTPAFTSTDVAGTSTSASTTLLPHPVIKETTDHSSLATTTPTTITNETAGSLFTSTGLVSNQTTGNSSLVNSTGLVSNETTGNSSLVNSTDLVSNETTGNSSLVNSTGLVSNETTGNSSLVNSTGLVSNEMTGNSSMANSTGLVSKETADNSSLVNSTTDSTSPAPNTTHVSSTTPGINETQVTTNTSSTSTSQISNPTASTTASAVIQQDTRRGKPGNSTTDGIVSQKIRPLSGSAVAVAVIGTIVVLGLLVGALVWKKRERYTRLDEDQPVGSQSNYTNPVYGL
ncbi:serine-rich adhesin for platelets-like [Acipenser oxyrinchus oxyrinchus]|uniref:Serine-rich adhesin for platelets-like n=1 Tax=Acipenser oxyrinchus oxyrinchus TaxID=40147 RepID=A0AAD8D2G1_ACIOX|nr:serine-rich adhesin for platelets-like [Acipenser oxyrinchus oxyrinchus]